MTAFATCLCFFLYLAMPRGGIERGLLQLEGIACVLVYSDPQQNVYIRLETGERFKFHNILRFFTRSTGIYLNITTCLNHVICFRYISFQPIDNGLEEGKNIAKCIAVNIKW